MGILCVGQSAYDITIPIQEPIIDNRKYRFSKEFRCGGGPAFNAACLCAKWGARVQLVSRIGNDEYGKNLREILTFYGVNMDGLILDGETPYSYIFVNTKSGNRTVFNHVEECQNIMYPIKTMEPDVILTDGHEEEISRDIIGKFPNAISVIDAGSYRESTYQVAKQVDYLVCSEDFVRQYLQCEIDLKKWNECIKIFSEIKKINRKKVVITLGKQGLLYEENQQINHLPAFEVNAIDTTGAGDLFHGAFAYGIYKQMTLKSNLIQSSKAAALSVQSLGGQSSIPTLEKVRQE